MSSRISGVVDYTKLAQQHRAMDADALNAEVKRLAASGLKPRDIASALGVHPMIVVRLLEQA